MKHDETQLSEWTRELLTKLRWQLQKQIGDGEDDLDIAAEAITYALPRDTILHRLNCLITFYPKGPLVVTRAEWIATALHFGASPKEAFRGTFALSYQELTVAWGIMR